MVDIDQDSKLFPALFAFMSVLASLEFFAPLKDVGLNFIRIGDLLECDFSHRSRSLDIDKAVIKQGGEEAWSLGVDILNIA